MIGNLRQQGGWIPRALVLALGLPACSACNGEPAPVDNPVPSTDSGTGGAAGSGGYAAGGAAGAAIPDAAPDAPADGDSRVDLTWKVLGTAAGCTVERVVNPEAIRLFEWIPCAETPNCEEARFLIREPVGDDVELAPPSFVHDSGEVTRLALTLRGIGTPDDTIVVYSTPEGALLDGYRSTGDPSCKAMAAGAWGNRFGARTTGGGSSISSTGFSVVLGTFDNAEPKLCVVDASLLPGAGGSATRVMGASRWVWDWVPGQRFFSFSNTDCSGMSVFASTPLDGSVYALGNPSSTGHYFLFSQWAVAGEGVMSSLHFSDGQSPPQSYLVPEPGANYGTALFAHSHLAWLRGTGMDPMGRFEHVEWWASPFDGDFTALEPYKVADTSFVTTDQWSVGGFGFVATFSGRDGQSSPVHEIAVWNLADKTVRYHMLPQSRDINRFPGITRSHLWVAAAKHLKNGGDFFLRFPLE